MIVSHFTDALYLCRDMFSIITDGSLLPTTYTEPADYTATDPKTLDREATIDDICDFVVEYINSDVLVCGLMYRHALYSNDFLNYQGLLADRHLIIAGRLLTLSRRCGINCRRLRIH